MKDKIIIFVIGILLGAVISTGAFYIYTITKGSNECDNVQMNGGQPPEMPNGQNGEPPEKPMERMANHQKCQDKIIQKIIHNRKG